MKKILVTAVAAASLLAIAAHAAESTGFYLAPNLGWGQVRETVAGSSRQDNSGFAFGGNVGYLFSQNFGLEAGYTQYADAKYDAGIKGTKNYAFSLAGKGILPLQNGFNMFGKLGVAAVHHTILSTSATRPAALLGAGIGYDINQSFGVNAQVNTTTKNGPVPAMYAVTAGLTFNVAN